MRFVELHLDGFGRLVNRTFTFAPGFNLIFGPNEAGKSTLQQALLTLLYGFYEDGSVSKAKQQVTQALSPWTEGAGFSGRLSYQLDGGQTFRVTRSFSDRPTTRLETAPGGQDVSIEFRSASHGRLFFADKQLGMAKRVFENTCVVRQAELAALAESAQAITETLMRLSASASQDTSAADALAMLDKALRDEIGTDRAWTKPLAQSRKRLEELEETQQRTGRVRRETLALLAELNQEEAELERLDRNIERLNYLALVVERRILQAQIDASGEADEEAKRLAAEMERWRPWADFPAHLRDQVISISTHCTRLAQEVKDQTSQAAKARQQRMDLSDQLRAIESQAASLANAARIPVERLSEVQRLNVQWELATKAERTAKARYHQALERLAESERVLARRQQELGQVADLGLEGIDQLQGLWLNASQWVEHSEKEYQRAKTAWQQVGLSNEQFQAMAETLQQIESGTYKPERTPEGCRFWTREKPAQIAPPEIAIYAQVKPIRDQWDTARADVEAAKSNLASVTRRVQQVFDMTADQRVEQSFFDVANQQVAEYGRLMGETNKQQQTVDILQTQVQHAQSDTESARGVLSEVLRRIGYIVRDLEVAVASFEQDCARKAQYDQILADKQRLQSEERLLAQAEQAQLRREEALRSSLQSLRVLLKQAGIAMRRDDVASAVTEFEEKHHHHQQWLRAREKHQAALDRPASGLTQQERDRVRKRLTVLQHQEKEARIIHLEWANLEATHDSHEYEEQSRKQQAARQAKRERCTQLREALARMTEDLPHPAALTEEIAASQAQVRRLESLRDVLTLAKDELEATTQEYQRAFAPRLEALVADSLAQATQGRYAEVGIDPSTLAVTLVAPERNEPVEAARFSTGTRDLIYLLLRIGVARFMSRTGETLPLLLDDPLVQFDRSRQESTLGLLANLAKETQIILFSKDDDILEWFQEELAGDERHRLQLLE